MRNQQKRSFYIATSNLLNFAKPHRIFYENAKPYSDKQYQAKLQGLTKLLKPAQADILAVQEIWDKDALIDLAVNLGFEARNVVAPGASNDANSEITQGKGALNTPSMGIISHFDVIESQLLTDFPEKAIIEIPDDGLYTAFNRPPLLVTLDVYGQPFMVLTAHLKSKRPHFLRDEAGEPLEDNDDPHVRVRAKVRSLVMRAAEAAAIRMTIIDKLHRTNIPLVLLGDMNDVTQSVTTQLLSESGEVYYDRSKRDVALFDATRIQTQYGWMQDVAYSHIHQGMPEIIDQIFISEEFLANSRFAIGEVDRVDYFNDHLKWDYADRASDHGVVRAKLKLYKKS